MPPFRPVQAAGELRPRLEHLARALLRPPPPCFAAPPLAVAPWRGRRAPGALWPGQGRPVALTWAGEPAGPLGPPVGGLGGALLCGSSI